MAIYTLTGHTIDEQGLWTPGTLAIEAREGAWYDAEDGGMLDAPLTARRVRQTNDDATGAIVISGGLTGGFAPDEVAFARTGMPISE